MANTLLQLHHVFWNAILRFYRVFLKGLSLKAAQTNIAAKLLLCW